MEKESVKAEAVLNCIDLSNPDINKLLHLLKHVKLSNFLLSFLLFVFSLLTLSFPPIFNLLLHFVNYKVMHRFWVFLPYQSRYKPRVYGRGFFSKQQVFQPSAKRKDEASPERLS